MLVQPPPGTDMELGPLSLPWGSCLRPVRTSFFGPQDPSEDWRLECATLSDVIELGGRRDSHLPPRGSFWQGYYCLHL